MGIVRAARAGVAAGAVWAASAAFDEGDVSDKPSFVASLPPLAARLARCAGIRGRDERVVGQPLCE